VDAGGEALQPGKSHNRGQVIREKKFKGAMRKTKATCLLGLTKTTRREKAAGPSRGKYLLLLRTTPKPSGEGLCLRGAFCSGKDHRTLEEKIVYRVDSRITSVKRCPGPRFEWGKKTLFGGNQK